MDEMMEQIKAIEHDFDLCLKLSRGDDVLAMRLMIAVTNFRHNMDTNPECPLEDDTQKHIAAGAYCLGLAHGYKMAKEDGDGEEGS